MCGNKSYTMCNVAFIIETGGRVGGVGLYFLDMLAGVLGLRTGGTRRPQRRLLQNGTVLRSWLGGANGWCCGASRWRWPGMLEQRVDEIHAPDRAVGRSMVTTARLLSFPA